MNHDPLPKERLEQIAADTNKEGTVGEARSMAKELLQLRTNVALKREAIGVVLQIAHHPSSQIRCTCCDSNQTWQEVRDRIIAACTKTPDELPTTESPALRKLIARKFQVDVYYTFNEALDLLDGHDDPHEAIQRAVARNILFLANDWKVVFRG